MFVKLTPDCQKKSLTILSSSKDSFRPLLSSFLIYCNHRTCTPSCIERKEVWLSPRCYQKKPTMWRHRGKHSSVNFINILWAAHAPIFCSKKLQSQTALEKSCALHFCMKKGQVKCWWNWHLKFSVVIVCEHTHKQSMHWIFSTMN